MKDTRESMLNEGLIRSDLILIGRKHGISTTQVEVIMKRMYRDFDQMNYYPSRNTLVYNLNKKVTRTVRLNNGYL